jgi:hypothetical protein
MPALNTGAPADGITIIQRAKSKLWLKLGSWFGSASIESLRHLKMHDLG